MSTLPPVHSIPYPPPYPGRPAMAPMNQMSLQNQKDSNNTTFSLTRPLMAVGLSLATGVIVTEGLGLMLPAKWWQATLKRIDKLLNFINPTIERQKKKSISLQKLLGDINADGQIADFKASYFEDKKGRKGFFKPFVAKLPARIQADLKTVLNAPRNSKEGIESADKRFTTVLNDIKAYANKQDKPLRKELYYFRRQLAGFGRWLRAYDTQKNFLNDEYKLLQKLKNVGPAGRLIQKSLYYLQRIFTDNPIARSLIQEKGQSKYGFNFAMLCLVSLTGPILRILEPESRDAKTSGWRKGVDDIVDVVSGAFWGVAGVHLVEQTGLFRHSRLGAWIQSRPVFGKAIHTRPGFMGGFLGFTWGGILEMGILPLVFAGLAAWGAKAGLHAIYGPVEQKEKSNTNQQAVNASFKAENPLSKINQGVPPNNNNQYNRGPNAEQPNGTNGLAVQTKGFQQGQYPFNPNFPPVNPYLPRMMPGQTQTQTQTQVQQQVVMPWMQPPLPPVPFAHPPETLFIPNQTQLTPQNTGLSLDQVEHSPIAQHHQEQTTHMLDAFKNNPVTLFGWLHPKKQAAKPL